MASTRVSPSIPRRSFRAADDDRIEVELPGEVQGPDDLALLAGIEGDRQAALERRRQRERGTQHAVVRADAAELALVGVHDDVALHGCRPGDEPRVVDIAHHHHDVGLRPGLPDHEGDFRVR